MACKRRRQDTVSKKNRNWPTRTSGSDAIRSPKIGSVGRLTTPIWRSIPPIYVDRAANTTRLWVTLGVRLCPLTAEYSVPPRIKPGEGDADWQVADPVEASNYLLAVDEFAEVELKGVRVLTRDELRAVADEHQTKEAIVRALER